MMSIADEFNICLMFFKFNGVICSTNPAFKSNVYCRMFYCFHYLKHITSIKTTLRSPVHGKKLCPLFSTLEIFLFYPFDTITKSTLNIIEIQN